MKENQMIRRALNLSADLHIREAGEQDERMIEGYAILFDSPSQVLLSDDGREVREVIDRGAVTRDLLDGSDIVLNMFHDNSLILGRSCKGQGTLSYEVDDRGVLMRCALPRTADGDKTYELIRRGDITGMSFCFSTYYHDGAYVERSAEDVDGKTHITCRVKRMTGIYDFSVVVHPAYADTSVEARELGFVLREEPDAEPAEEPEVEEEKTDNSGQVREMRMKASEKIF